MLAGISWPAHAICCLASVGFLKNPVHGSMVGRQISVESDFAASTVGPNLVADHEKVRILLNPQQIARQMGFERPAGVGDGTCE